MAQSSHLDREAVLDLLYPPGQKRKASDLEEHRNPWRPIPGASHPWDVPLLRVMAGYTGSQPDEDNCMTARAARQRLTTHEARKAALDIHVNYKTWLPTPFISFTKSPTRIDELVRKMPHRGWHTLVAIDPKRRLKKHLPILDLSREMAKYGVEDPYGKSGQFYPDEYLCPWEVTGEEVIGVWKWNELTRCKDWYQEKIMPTFRDSRNRSCDSSAEGPKQPSPEPLSELLERLSRK